VKVARRHAALVVRTLTGGGVMGKRFLLVMVAVVLAAGCGTARRSPPVVEALPLTTLDLQRGYETFMAHCHACHPGGEAGLGPALNDKPLPRFLMRMQVRRGLGAMPAFPQEVISDQQLDQLLDYLVALRRHG
jgi:mono/diheme cytochrome c family protein